MAFAIGNPIIDPIVNTFLVNVQGVTIYAIAIAIYAIIIWHYYRLLAKRDFFSFEATEGEGTTAWILNFFSEMTFLAKYVIFFPLVSFIFFTIFASMLFLMSKEQTIPMILFIGAATIAGTRITAYYNEELARDIAKLIPLTLLGIFVIQSDFFSIGILFERINALPEFFVEIASFILFFLLLEIVLRLVYSAKKLAISDKPSRRQIRKEMKVDAEEIREKIAEQAVRRRQEIIHEQQKAAEVHHLMDRPYDY